MDITQRFFTISRYSRPGLPLKSITKIAIHWVGNAGSTALGNWNYFEDLKNKRYDKNGKIIVGSCHYIIGLDGEIIQCIPENEISYCTNSANNYSISIENCHPDWTGKFTESTLNSMIELSYNLCKKYNLNPINDLIRHYDITRKDCPRWFVNNPDEWNKFKQSINDFTYKPTLEQIIQKFVDKGYINTPDYWIENVRKDKFIEGSYMSLLLQRVTQTVCRHDAVSKLIELGLINSPDEWIPNLIVGKLINGEYVAILLGRLYNVI